MKNKKINTQSFVHIGDRLVNTDDLSDEQKDELAAHLKVTYLNELFRGIAEFQIDEEI